MNLTRKQLTATAVVAATLAVLGATGVAMAAGSAGTPSPDPSLSVVDPTTTSTAEGPENPADDVGGPDASVTDGQAAADGEQADDQAGETEGPENPADDVGSGATTSTPDDPGDD